MNDNFKLITFWLSSERNWQAGVELYNKFGTNSVLKVMFKNGYSAYREEQLIKEMKALQAKYSSFRVEKNEPEKVSVQKEAEQFLHSILRDGIRPSDLPNAPEAVKEAVRKRRNLYAEFVRLHATLNKYTPKIVRLENALRILTIFDEIKPLWDFTNYYDINLRLPDEKQEFNINQLSIAEQNKLYCANYKYVRKFFGVESKQDEIAKRIAQNEQLKEALVREKAFFHEALTLPEMKT